MFKWATPDWAILEAADLLDGELSGKTVEFVRGWAENEGGQVGRALLETVDGMPSNLIV